MQNKAYSLIELLTATTIIGISCCVALPSLQRLLYLQTAIITMQDLRDIMNYARSVAVLRQTKVKICPSQDGISCSYSWGVGLLVLSDQTKPQYFKLPIAPECALTLAKSGFSNQKVEIQATGATNSNGHFNYKSIKHNALPQFNLYFNRAFRIYVLRE